VSLLLSSGALPGTQVGRAWVIHEAELDANLRELVRKQSDAQRLSTQGQREAGQRGVPRTNLLERGHDEREQAEACSGALASAAPLRGFSFSKPGS
jgi:hypothetical protein